MELAVVPFPSETLAGLTVQERLPEEDEDVRPTEPMNFWLVTVTVDVPFEPGITVTLRGLIATLKLETLIVTTTEWDKGS